MADRTNETLVVYKKDGTKVTEGEKGAKTAAITGLAAGTKVATGDYQASFKDTTTSKESDKVDVPDFEVPAAKPEEPVSPKAKPTADGANISAE